MARSAVELRGRTGEIATFDQLIAGARDGRSGTLVLRGEAGVGKTALLDHVQGSADGFRVLRCAGVESEMELAFAALHLLCAPVLDRIDDLPVPQRDALASAFGRSAAPPPDRFTVGLGVLTLLAGLAEERPLLCIVDDAQWLDRASSEVIGFVARRLLAERIALVFAVREPTDGEVLGDLPPVLVRGLDLDDARALLASVLSGPLDPRVRDRIVAETHGNPLALLELPRAWTAAELVDGFEQADQVPLIGRLEQGFRRRVEVLDADVRLLLLVAAAEPLGDAALLWRAAQRLGLSADPASAAEGSGLIELRGQVRFLHPLVRSAVYRSAPLRERQDVHRALADATDPAVDPDRRAWHRAQAAPWPDEEVAAELEHSAGRARARGGLVAAAAFLETAGLLTPEPTLRAERELAAAWVKRDAGLLDAALALLVAVESGPPDAMRTAQITHLRGQIAFDQRQGGDAVRLLREAAERLAPLDGALARETYLEAIAAALWAGGPDGGDVRAVAVAARGAPAAPVPPRAVDRVLDAFSLLLTDGLDAARPVMRAAVDDVLGLDGDPTELARGLWLVGNRAAGILATELWDYDASRALAARQVLLARDAGAHVQLQFALNFYANNEIFAGELSTAAAAVEEDRLVAQATGRPAVGYTAMLLAAFRGDERPAAELAETTAKGARERGQGRLVGFADYAAAVLANGLGRHDAALDAARRVFDVDTVGYRPLVAGELAEAALRSGDREQLERVCAFLAERVTVVPTPWSLGLEARARALAASGDDADAAYRESIDHLSTSALRIEAARGHLLYGEWLRKEGHRVEARAHLNQANEELLAMGLRGFAERAHRALTGSGETARKRSVDTENDLTAQETQIARLAREGLSNPEIGQRLFISDRTVEWHLRKVFTKLGIKSRRQLRDSAVALALD